MQLALNHHWKNSKLVRGAAWIWNLYGKQQGPQNIQNKHTASVTYQTSWSGGPQLKKSFHKIMSITLPQIRQVSIVWSTFLWKQNKNSSITTYPSSSFFTPCFFFFSCVTADLTHPSLVNAQICISKLWGLFFAKPLTGAFCKIFCRKKKKEQLFLRFAYNDGSDFRGTAAQGDVECCWCVRWKKRPLCSTLQQMPQNWQNALSLLYAQDQESSCH